MTHELSDQQILTEIASGNQHVFDDLYRSEYRKLFMLSFKYTRDQEIAEEVVHDVFIKIWNQASALVITQSLRSYLAKAIVNTSINAIKKIKVVHDHHERYKDELFEDFDDEDEAMALEKKMLLLERAIEKLPPQCKKVLLMSKYNKQKQQEIADQLNISIKTVKNHLSYAYKKIKENMENEIIMLLIVISYRTF